MQGTCKDRFIKKKNPFNWNHRSRNGALKLSSSKKIGNLLVYEEEIDVIHNFPYKLFRILSEGLCCKSVSNN